MNSKGIMAQIRQRLLDGTTAQQIIVEGYKSGSVFKAQWQLRKRGQLPPFISSLTETAPVSVPISVTELQAESLEESIEAFLDTSEDELERAQEAERLRTEARQWRCKAEDVEIRLAESQEAIRELQRDCRVLTPLLVWSGHPCVVCEKPTDGIVDKQTAAKLLKDTGHKDCLRQAGRRRSRFTDLCDDESRMRATVLADN